MVIFLHLERLSSVFDQPASGAGRKKATHRGVAICVLLLNRGGQVDLSLAFSCPIKQTGHTECREQKGGRGCVLMSTKSEGAVGGTGRTGCL